MYLFTLELPADAFAQQLATTVTAANVVELSAETKKMKRANPSISGKTYNIYEADSFFNDANGNRPSVKLVKTGVVS